MQAATQARVRWSEGADLRDFKRLNPNLRTLGLVPGEEFELPAHNVIEEFARSGADIIRLWPPWIFAGRDQSTVGETSALIEQMHQLGKPAWTTADVQYRDINPERPWEDLAELVRLGVNGILTDVPARYWHPKALHAVTDGVGHVTLGRGAGDQCA